MLRLLLVSTAALHFVRPNSLLSIKILKLDSFTIYFDRITIR